VIRGVSLVALLAFGLGAQSPRIEPSAFRRHAASTQADSARPWTPAERIVGRSLLGIIGSFVGGFVGIVLGAAIVEGPLNGQFSGSEDPGIEIVMVGWALGTVHGASFVASRPRFASSCTAKQRYSRGALIGGFLALLTFVGGYGIGDGGVLMMVGPLIGSAVGAVIGSESCG
jgi:hypothetical protein